jgi:hypothetical protein
MSTELLSDINVTNQKVAIVSRRKQYSDLDLSLIPHPNKKDIIPLTDIAAVKNSIKNLILTSRYERPFQPELDSGVRSMLFENADSMTRYMLTSRVKRIIDNYEPRVNNVIVQVEDDSDNNGYNITIVFNVITYDSQSDVRIFLERVR